MPEYPDLENYREVLIETFGGERLDTIDILHPFVLRSVDPEPQALVGRTLAGVERIGKRLVFDFGAEHFAVIHLMIAGRFRVERAKPESSGPRRSSGNQLCRFTFGARSLMLREAGSKRRASLSVVRGRDQLAQFDRGGLELFGTNVHVLVQRLRSENRTVKRALTDQRLFAGIGNAYSDEILHAAGLSPFKTTSHLSDAEARALVDTARRLLSEWTDRLRTERKGKWPTRVTAFHPEMAVHGKYGEPCPVCGAPVQRIRYADNESNYCATCQTDGTVLKDRALSRLLKDDWPSRIEELEV
jgi:formamidopyrimidine-DNA glycosylase